MRSISAHLRRVGPLACSALIASAVLSGCATDSKQSTAKARATSSTTTTPARSTPPLGASAVARVGAHTLTRKELDHWVAIESVVSYEYKPTRPVPKGVLPDPPTYAACTAYLRSKAKTATGTASPTKKQLRAECVQAEKGLQRHTMELLLTDYWVQEEAAARGIKVTMPEVRQLLHEEFANERERRRFLKITHQSVGDELFLLESKLRLRNLQRSISPLRPNGHESAQMAAEVDRAYAKLGNQMKRKWIPRTECRPGFVVVECRAYGPVEEQLAGE